MSFRPFALVVSVALATAQASAGETTFRLAGRPDVEWSIPYTFGTHRGTADALTIEARWDAEESELTVLSLRVPIESLHSGNVTRDCHLREALGLDYSGSRYPAAHACDRKDELPPTGPDRVVFPEIVFETVADSSPVRCAVPAPGQRTEVEVPGRWTIHGVSRVDRVKATVSTTGANPPTFRVEGEHTFSLADFGVVVKPFLLSRVGDRVHVKFSFSISP